jgi:DNA-binding GntR family transcriptional regulator
MPKRKSEIENTAQRISRALEDDIVSGRILPGAHLEELVLAERFQVSRTPVREALQQLVTAELAVKRPRRGVVVAQISEERLRLMFEAMAELESTCGRLAALRMSPGERKELAALHQHISKTMSAGDIEHYIVLNRTFHNLIYQGARNDVLVDLSRGIRLRVAPYRRVQFNNLMRLASSHAEHGAIVEAIQRADAQAAADALYRHIMSVQSVTLALLNSQAQ